jgi:hypothetical protein
MAADASWVADEDAHRSDWNARGLYFVCPVLSRNAIDWIHDNAVDMLSDQLVDIIRLGEGIDVGIKVDRLRTGFLGGLKFPVLQGDRVGRAKAQMGPTEDQLLLLRARRSGCCNKRRAG